MKLSKTHMIYKAALTNEQKMAVAKKLGIKPFRIFEDVAVGWGFTDMCSYTNFIGKYDTLEEAKAALSGCFHGYWSDSYQDARSYCYIYNAVTGERLSDNHQGVDYYGNWF